MEVYIDDHLYLMIMAFGFTDDCLTWIRTIFPEVTNTDGPH